MKIIHKQALKISLIFLVLSFLWILYSDKVLLSLFSDPEKLTQIQTYKGWFYVLIVSVIIYLLVEREIVKTILTEKNLKAEQTKYKTLFDTANDAIFIMDENNVFIDCNRKTLELFSCSRDQILGISPIDVSPQFQVNNIETSKLAVEKINNARKGSPQRFEWLHTTFDKTSVFSAEIALTMTLIGNVKYLFAIVRDISDRKSAELELKTKNYEYETLNEELKEKLGELQAAEEELKASNDELVYINEELGKSEERYRTIADFTYDWEYWQLPDGKFEYISPSCEEITGYRREEFIENPLLLDSIIINEDWQIWNNHKEKEKIKDAYNKDNLKGEEKQCELVYRIKTKNGDLKWIGHHCQSIFDKERNYLGKRGSNRDITMQKYAEEQLKMQEKHFRLMVENMPVLINAYDKDGNFIFWNKECERVTGYKANEVIGNSNVLSKLYPDQKYRKEKLNLDLHNVSNLEIDLLNKKGNKKTVLWTNINKPAPLKKWDGWEVGIDITERKNAERALKNSEESLQALLNATIESALLCSTDGTVLIINNIGAKRINQNTKDIIGKNIFDFFPEESRDLRRKMGKKVEKTKSSVRFQDGRNGQYFDTSIYPVFDENGVVTALSIFSTDITKRKIAEIALRESEERYRILVENGPSVFWITDKSGKTSYISPNVSNILGYSQEEIYLGGKELWLSRIHKEEVENVFANFSLIFTENKQFDVIYRVKAKNGDWIWLHDVGEKYINDSGKELAYGVMTNITVKKQTEQKVLHAMINAEERERSRIAKELHDGVSPVLSAIKLYIQSMNDSLDEGIKNELSEKINDTIGEAIASIKEISNNISPHILQNFGLTRAVESFVDKVRGLEQLNISIESKLTERFSIDIETALYRITTELINNTFKYAKAKNVSIKYLIKGSEVIMKYSDDGIGFNIDQAWKNKIGMGIFNMKNRIRSLNGQFNIRSELNKGIEVYISVPVNE